jgi:type 1 glutamine amidotransferase
MKKPLLLSLALALAGSTHAAEPKRLLLVTITSGFVHAAIPISEQMVRDMAGASGGEFTIISTSDSPNYPGAEYRATIDQRDARIPREGAPDNRMTAEQVLAVAAGGPAAGRAGGGAPGGGGRGGPTAFPGQATGATAAQQAALTLLGQPIIPLSTEAANARTALTVASLANPGPAVAADLIAKTESLAKAEQALATARAEALARIQSSPDRLSSAQVLALAGTAPAGGRGGRGGAPAAPAPGMTLAEKNAAVLKEYLSPEALKNYDAVAFLSTVGELPLPDKDAFFKWVADGHGFIGLHAAADGLHMTPEYIKMLGGEFSAHGSHSEVAVVNLDPASPLTAGWKNGIKITEEWYNFRNYDRSQVHVLLAMETHPTNGAPGHYPVSWIKPYGKGRVFYSSLGHRDDVIDPRADIGDAEFKVRYNPPETALMVQKHLLAGIRYALGLVNVDDTVGTR